MANPKTQHTARILAGLARLIVEITWEEKGSLLTGHGPGLAFSRRKAHLPVHAATQLYCHRFLLAGVDSLFESHRDMAPDLYGQDYRGR